MRISDCSADVCSSDLVFDYPYPKAVLKVDIAEKHGVQEKHSGKAASHKMTMRIRVRNDHSVALRDCSVHVLGYRTNGHWTEIYERLRGGDARTEGHTSKLQSLMSSSYAVFCLKQQNS